MSWGWTGGGKTTMVSGLQVWRWRVYSDGGLGEVYGSTPFLYKRWTGLGFGLEKKGVGWVG